MRETDGKIPTGQALPRALAARVPFYYGWIVLACLCCAGFARQGPAVATLSIFIEPLTREFGWSRTAVSGAVSLGGLLAVLVSPLIGPLLDRRGSRLVLCLAVLLNGVALLLLSLTPSLLIFYLLYCFARMNWAGPFDLGIYGALNNWFLTRRTAAASVANLAQMLGLVAMPLIAQFAILHHGWRAGWVALGIVTLVVGFVPVWLLLVRRPEDMGLQPDRAGPAVEQPGAVVTHEAEPRFSRREAIRTPAFWLLMLYTVMVYPVQAGGESASGAAPGGAWSRRDHGGTDRQQLLPHVGAGNDGLRIPAAAMADPVPVGAGGSDARGRHMADAGRCLRGGRLPRRRVVRGRNRRCPDFGANCVGRLFRAGELRRDPWPCSVGAGAGAGGRTLAVRRVVRLDRHVHDLVALLRNAVGAEHRRRACRKAAQKRRMNRLDRFG